MTPETLNTYRALAARADRVRTMVSEREDYRDSGHAPRRDMRVLRCLDTNASATAAIAALNARKEA